MSYNYSKFERNKVYDDPATTISRYQVMCKNKEEYAYENVGYLILYLTQNGFIIRSPYDPNVFNIKGYSQVYLEIPFSSIVNITCCGEEFSQIISLNDLPQSKIQKNKISIEFKKDENTVQKLDFSINCYLSISKNAKECQELIDMFNKTAYNETSGHFKLQERPLFTDKMYLHCPILNIDGRFLIKAFYNRFEFKPESSAFEKIIIPIENIISLTHEQTLKGSGRRLKQDNFLKLIYKDGFNEQITIFMKFDIFNNSYPKKYIDFMTKLTDLGIW